MAVSPDGQRILAGSTGVVVTWNFKDEKRRQPIPGWPLAASPDLSVVLVGNSDGRVRVVNVQDGQILRVLEGHTGLPNLGAYSADGRIMVTSGGPDRTVRIWSAAGKTTAVLKHPCEVGALHIARDSARIVTACRDGSLRVWNAESGSLIHTFASPGLDVAGVRFAPDRRSVLAVDAAGSLHLYSEDGRRLTVRAERLGLAAGRDARLRETLVFAGSEGFFAAEDPSGLVLRWSGSNVLLTPEETKAANQIEKARTEVEVRWKRAFRSAEWELANRKLPAFARVVASALNVRNIPSAGGSHLGTLPRGEVVEHLARSKEPSFVDGRLAHWYRLRSGKLTGWAFGGYLELNEQ